MLLVRDKEGDLCLIANYEVNYPMTMDMYNNKILQTIKTPLTIQKCRKTKVKDIKRLYYDKIDELKEELSERKKIIRMLDDLEVNQSLKKEIK